MDITAFIIFIIFRLFHIDYAFRFFLASAFISWPFSPHIISIIFALHYFQLSLILRAIAIADHFTYCHYIWLLLHIFARLLRRFRHWPLAIFSFRHFRLSLASITPAPLRIVLTPPLRIAFAMIYYDYASRRHYARYFHFRQYCHYGWLFSLATPAILHAMPLHYYAIFAWCHWAARW